MLFFTAVVFGFGLLLGLDPLISQAFGAGDREGCRRTLWQGVYLGLMLTPPSMGLIWGMVPWMESWGIHPEVAALAGPYVRIVSWSTAPLFLFLALRHYLQAMGRVHSLVLSLVVGNVLNAVGNWLLIDGNLGFPALGVEGSAWSTVLSRLAMPLVLLGDAWRVTPGSRAGLPGMVDRWEWARMAKLLRLGWPAAVHLSLEVGVFALATALAGRLVPAALAAHQIVLNLASTTFMVPLGIASAGSVRVGQAIGRRDFPAAQRAGWTAIGLGAGFMACAGIGLALVPRFMIGLFSVDPDVLRVGTGLMYVAALFQLFDGIQVVSTGVLRGAGETRWPMLCNLFAHWMIGLPVGYGLGLVWGWGALGLWIGLSAGLMAAGVTILTLWASRAQRLCRQPIDA
jgi:MATE family multidrug resistance protein